MIVNRARQTVWVKKESVDLDDRTMDQIKAQVEIWTNTYGPNAKLQSYFAGGWGDKEYWGVFVLEPESDIAMNLRIAQEEAEVARQAAQAERYRQEKAKNLAARLKVFQVD